ncbi:MAG TPA: ATP-binding protein [Thermoleophilaceae bacterium]|nr:ATP-binding protein [Thermoleophilaceae bacterium]
MRESWLPAAPRSAALARSLVREAAAKRGLGPPEVWDLMLATTEAVANVVKHGAPCGERGFRLRIGATSDRLQVEVCDCGLFADELDDAGPDETHGRGIPLIAAVSDEFELRPRGPFTRVRFAKRLAA